MQHVASSFVSVKHIDAFIMISIPNVILLDH